MQAGQGASGQAQHIAARHGMRPHEAASYRRLSFSHMHVLAMAGSRAPTNVRFSARCFEYCQYVEWCHKAYKGCRGATRSIRNKRDCSGRLLTDWLRGLPGNSKLAPK